MEIMVRTLIQDEDALMWYQRIEMPLSETRVYLSQPFRTRARLFNPGGVFFPRNLTGYVFADGAPYLEILRRYIHESSHGSFFENTNSGGNIVTADRNVYEKESELFDGPIDGREIVVVTQDDIKNPTRSSFSEAKKVNKELTFQEGVEYHLVGVGDFGIYLDLVERLERFMDYSEGYIEGFALISEEELLGFSRDSASLPEVLGIRYKELDELRKRGFRYLVEFLKSLRIDGL